MSMNLVLRAKIEAIINKRKHTLIKYCDLWQTPTKVTYEILKSSDIFEAYKKWVLSIPRNTSEPLATDDGEEMFRVFQPHEDEEDPREAHIKEVEDFLKEYEGWEISWYDM